LSNSSRAMLTTLREQLSSARKELRQQHEDGSIQAYVPGLLATASLAKLANHLGATTGFSPFLWASVVGMAAGNFISVVSPSSKRHLSVGVGFVKSRLLRAGIVLYGAKLTLQQLTLTGAAGVLADLATTSSTILLGWGIGTQILGLSAPLTVLISSGAAICGCSAVAATQSVVEGEAHEVTAAIGSVVMCSTALMFLYPVLWRLVPSLASNPRLMGIFTGATVHEVAGVVAVGNACSADVAATALVTKLVRVCLLAPFLLMLSAGRDALRIRARSGGGKLALPWFALGLLSVATINSFVTLPPVMLKGAGTLSATLVAMSMAATGLDADIRKIMKLGPRPMILALSLLTHLIFAGGLITRLALHHFP